MENDEVSLDLGRLAKIVWSRKAAMLSIIVLGILISTIIALRQPKYYESTAMVQTRSAGKDVSLASSMGIDVRSNVFRELPLNYVEIMKSRAVLQPVIDKLEWDNEKTKPTVDQFVKNMLKIENTNQTTLITITAKGKTPEEAQQISQGVVDNFLLLQATLNQQTQSLQVQLLKERIETAKKEADDAAQNLATLSDGASTSSTSYRQLQREAKIKNDSYLNLVKQCEQAKIQETLESMDIQIIDSANLPDVEKPAPSKKKITIGIGFLTGCFISLVYALIVYKWGK